MKRAAATLLMSLLTISTAFADGRIGPGISVPLNVEKAGRKGALKQLINSCYYDETLISLLPDLISVKPSTGTSPTIVEDSEIEQDRQGDATAWTTVQRFYPKKSVEMKFAEAKSPTNSVTRSLTLEASASAGWGANMKTNMRASLQTDIGGEDLDVELSIEAALPYFEVKGKGSQVCGANDWGRDGCRDTAMEIEEVNLVIPADFVPQAVWMNYATSLETKKTFDFMKYAECLLNTYEQ